MLSPDVLHSIQYNWSSFRSCPLFPIQTGPNFCYRLQIVLKFVGAFVCEWWFYWGVRWRLPSSCCGVLFGASGMSCVWSIPGALYTQTSWPLLYVGKVFILHHLQRNAYLISRWESRCTNAHIVQNLAI